MNKSLEANKSFELTCLLYDWQDFIIYNTKSHVIIEVKIRNPISLFMLFLCYSSFVLRVITPYELQAGAWYKPCTAILLTLTGPEPNHNILYEEVSTEYAFRAYVNRQPDCSSNPHFLDKIDHVPVVSHSLTICLPKHMPSLAIALPLFLYSSHSGANLFKVSLLYTFQGWFVKSLSS